MTFRTRQTDRERDTAAFAALASRKSRAIAGLVTATIAILAAAVAHLVAGGQLPGIVGVAAPWLLSVMICTLLANAKRSTWRLLVGATAAQVLFHYLFAIGAGGMDFTTSAHTHTGAAQMTMLPSLPSHSMSFESMLVAHAVAAGVTVIAVTVIHIAVEKIAVARTASAVVRHYSA